MKMRNIKNQNINSEMVTAFLANGGKIQKCLSAGAYEKRIGMTGKSKDELSRMSDDELLAFDSIGRRTLRQFRLEMKRREL